MSTVTVATPFNIDLEFNIAPFHKRLLAWLVDILVIVSYAYVVIRFVVHPLSLDNELAESLTTLIILLPALCYHLAMEVWLNGQTLGKKALGIKVIDGTGKEPAFSQYLLRWAFRIVDITATWGILAVFSIALNKYSQRVGDMVAGTMVIDSKARAYLAETIYLDVEDNNYTPVFLQVLKLTDKDMNGIRNLLGMKYNSENEGYMAQVAGRIKAVLEIESTLSPRELLGQLLKDYNYLTSK